MQHNPPSRFPHAQATGHRKYSLATDLLKSMHEIFFQSSIFPANGDENLDDADARRQTNWLRWID
jgi:hypothetical protein